jgi:hypothetical protein
MQAAWRWATPEPCSGSRAAQTLAARQVVARGLSVRETERLVRRLQAEDGSGERARTPAEDPDIRRLQDDLAERLGARVAIQHGTKGTGKLVIAYNSLDELDGIFAHIQPRPRASVGSLMPPIFSTLIGSPNRQISTGTPFCAVKHRNSRCN